MRSRHLLSACTVALLASSCAQTEPEVLSEGVTPSSAQAVSSATVTSPTSSEPGRFIARCATEADGGTPGMTTFSDGSEGVTDHCLQRYYIGVQPAPGALYVPDMDAGTYGPSEQQLDTGDAGWTPAQPRTDRGPLIRADGLTEDEQLPRTAPDGTPLPEDPAEEPGTDASEPLTEPGVRPTDTPEATTPGQTTPGQTTPEQTTPEQTTPGQTSPGQVTTPTTTAPGAAPGGTTTTPTGTAPTASRTAPPVLGTSPSTSLQSTVPTVPFPAPSGSLAPPAS